MITFHPTLPIVVAVLGVAMLALCVWQLVAVRGRRLAWLRRSLLVLLADRPWALVVGWAALPIAMMTHGMAAAYGPGLLFLAALVWRRGHRRIAIGSLVAGAVGYAPRAAQLVRKVLDEGFEGASQLAAYNSEGDRFWAELVHRTSDHLLHRDGLPWGPLWGLTPLLILAAVWVAPRISPSSDLPRRVRDVCAWALLTLAGIVTVAWMIRYMQGYHWRVVYPAGAAAIGVGLDVLLRRIPRRAQAGAAAVVLAVAAVGAGVVAASAGDEGGEGEKEGEGAGHSGLHPLGRTERSRVRWGPGGFEVRAVCRSHIGCTPSLRGPRSTGGHRGSQPNGHRR